MRGLPRQWIACSAQAASGGELDGIDWSRIVPFHALYLGCIAVVWGGASAVAVAVVAYRLLAAGLHW